MDIASSFQSGKAVGFDKIPMSIIKQSINAISQPLTHIINLSITHGIVPDEMKIARVIPLFKTEDRDVFTNYRPVSIPSFSKFIERTISRTVFWNTLINTIYYLISSTVFGKIIQLLLL
jgi:ABC-type sugar transport system permease subunit